MKTVAVPANLPSSRSGWWVVVVLCAGGVVAMLDRQVIILLVEPIKADLAISDTDISLLQGLAVALFYAVLAVPLGRLADSGNRRNIIAAGALLFALSTMAGGFAFSFGALFVARLCVGIGEATLTPAGSSLISDYLPPQKVGRAMGFFVGSSFAGSGLALIVLGAVIGWLAANPAVQFPLIGRPNDWQLVFIAASLPGIAFAFTMLLVREPPRAEGLALAGTATGNATLTEVLTFVRLHIRLLGPVFFGLPILAAAQFGLNVWTPTFFIRTYGWSPGKIGPVFGLMVSVLSTSGVICGGWLADRLLARGRIDANLLVSMSAALVAAPFILAFPLAGSPILSLLLLGPVLFFGAMPFGAGPAAIPVLAPNRMRAQLMAIYLLFGNLLGAGLGPWMIAAFTDDILRDPQAIRFSIAFVGTGVIFAGAGIVGIGVHAMRSPAGAKEVA